MMPCQRTWVTPAGSCLITQSPANRDAESFVLGWDATPDACCEKVIHLEIQSEYGYCRPFLKALIRAASASHTHQLDAKEADGKMTQM